MTNDNPRARILRTAESLVNGDRADTYGPPEASFGRIAELWNAIGFTVIDPSGAMRELLATDAALALALLKVSRIVSSPDHEDSWVDLAGYAALGGEMATRDLPPAPRTATYEDVAAWLESGEATGVTGNRLIADRIREVFGEGNR